MKKLKSTWYNMAGSLTLISVVAGASLASVNEMTKGPIELIKKQTLESGIRAVLNSNDLQVQDIKSLEDGSVIIYRTDKGNAVQATDGNAFGGKLTVLVGFDSQGSIQGYQVLETSETPGLGAKASSWFKEGKGSIIGKNPSKNNLTVSKDGGEVDAITASTITSRAFLRCVNDAYKALNVSADAESGASQQVDNN